MTAVAIKKASVNANSAGSFECGKQPWADGQRPLIAQVPFEINARALALVTTFGLSPGITIQSRSPQDRDEALSLCSASKRALPGAMPA
jgi:hypothetical protein